MWGACFLYMYQMILTPFPCIKKQAMDHFVQKVKIIVRFVKPRR